MDSEASDMKIALIGGSGFIGQRTVHYLTTVGHVVKIIGIAVPLASRSNVAYKKIATCATLRLSRLRSAAIINLAAARRNDVRPMPLYHDVNVQGAQTFCADTVFDTQRLPETGFFPIA
jgi:nucleoside-diphosphate-sugar epimerase